MMRRIRCGWAVLSAGCRRGEFRGMIQFRDMMRQLREPSRDRSGHPVPVHVEVVTCDLAKNTGGQLLELDGVVLARHARRAGLDGDEPAAGTRRLAKRRLGKANEYAGGTLNLFLVASRQVRKVHARLITRFNHETVVY